MKIKIIKSNPELIQELTEEEYSYLEEALKIPPEKLPFSNIFGDKYRIIDSYGTMVTTNSFGAMIKKLNSWGWNLADHEGDKAIELYKEYLLTRPDIKSKAGEPDYKSEPKYAKMSLKKLITKMHIFFSKSLPAMHAKAKEMKEKHYTSIDKAREQYDVTSMSPEDIENYKKDLAQLDAKFGIPFKALTAKMKSGANLYFGDNGRYHYNYLVNYQDMTARTLKIEIDNFVKLIDDERAMYKIQSNFDKIFEPSYIIYSRHPVDVFRMSDFVQVTSCHTPPSKRHLTSLPAVWDGYNICALAEAHANGMIAYAIPPESFEKAGIEPTQDGINEYEDGELFYDDERDVDGLQPLSRVRIRNTTYTDPESKQTTKLAVPDQKVYGSAPPNFSKTVRDYTAAAQKEEFDKVFNSDGVEKLEDGEINIPLENFQRFGGSYEDGGASVKDNLPLMFATAVNVPAAKITMPGFLHYDQSLEDELESNVADSAPSLQRLNTNLNDALERVNGMRFKIMTSIDEDYDGNFFYTSINLQINVPLPSYMTEIVKEQRSEVYSFFKDYEDDYALHFEDGEKTPRDIFPYPKDSPETQDLGLDTAWLRITYKYLDELMNDAGVRLDPESPREVLQIILDNPSDGGFGVEILTDPYVDDAFPQKTAALLAVSPFGDDPEFYLTKVLNSVLTPDQNAGDWQGQSLDLEYHPSGIEYWQEAEFESTMDLEDDWMLELGLSPEQVGLFIVALNQNKEVQNKVVELIEKYLYPKADSILPMIIETNGATVGVIEVGSDYKEVASMISQAGGDMQTFNFPIKIELVSHEIDTRNKMILLTKILGEYEDDDTLNNALKTSEGQALIRQVIEAATPKAVTENKRRTTIRILRG